jgi:hypothetical protein
MIPTIRCSALPRILSCTASAEKPDIDIDSGGKVADIGTAAHEFYARMVRENLDEPGDLFQLAEKLGVDEDELRMLAWSGLREWKKVRDRIEVWNVEGEMAKVVDSPAGSAKALFKLTGHPDLNGRLKADPTTGVIIDWKAGYKENVYLPQTKGYALLDLLIYGNNPNHPMFKGREFIIPEKYLLLVVWTRLGVTETFEFPTADIIDLREQLCRIFSEETRRYVPNGSNCEYCPLALDCPARRALILSAGRDMLAIGGEESTREVTPAALAALYPQSRMLKKALESYEASVRQVVEDAGGILPDGQGMELALEESPRETIHFPRKQEVFKNFLTDSEIENLLASLTISKEKLKKSIMQCAPNRKGNANLNACIEALRQAGTVEKKQITKLSYRKTITQEKE